MDVERVQSLHMRMVPMSAHEYVGDLGKMAMRALATQTGEVAHPLRIRSQRMMRHGYHCGSR
jgi:hypothetical protein